MPALHFKLFANMKLSTKPLEFPGLLLVEPKRFGDDRGYFEETWNRRVFADAGIDVDFVQDNHSLSAPVGTQRGLHFQAPPHAQAVFRRAKLTPLAG